MSTVNRWPFAAAKRYFRVDQYSNKVGKRVRKIHSLEGDRTGLCENSSPVPAQARPGEEEMGGRGQVLPTAGDTREIHSGRSAASDTT
jgi:hypothetical protein